MTNETAPDIPLPPTVAPPARDPLLPLDTNVAPTTDKTIGKIKKKKLRLPHPYNLDVLPSPTKKWSVTTHPIKA